MARRQFRRPHNAPPVEPALPPGMKPGETQTPDNPALVPPVAEPEVVAGAEVPAAPREKTLHELNIEARETDRWHAEQRRLAQEKIDAEIGPMMRGVQRSGRVMRRTQKPLRAPVKP